MADQERLREAERLLRDLESELLYRIMGYDGIGRHICLECGRTYPDHSSDCATGVLLTQAKAYRLKYGGKYEEEP